MVSILILAVDVLPDKFRIADVSLRLVIKNG